MPHSINHGDACLAYFNKIWGIPVTLRQGQQQPFLPSRHRRLRIANRPPGVVSGALIAS
jgi:hypothetical protein